VMIGIWKKQEGDAVVTDESVVEIESDKATVELPAPGSGTISKILKGSGERATVGEVIGYMELAGAAAPPAQTAAPVAPPVAAAPPPVAAAAPRVMPAAARVLGEAGVAAGAAVATGPGGRVTKADAQQAVAAAPAAARSGIS
jgi:2-oxoglutarate dehydrogenase E2 component (dihydrolipoamide succinyltransferase)